MKKRCLFLIAIIIFIFALFKPTNAYAEAYLSDKSETKYDVTSGLLTGKANTICQTDDGYIWIGQYAGLTKYDNKTFTTMTSLQGYNLTSIVSLASKGNKLFIGSEKGFFIKDEYNVITQIETTDASLVVKDIKISGNNALVGTTSGLFTYDIETGKIVRNNTLSISRIALLNDSVYYYIVGKNELHCNMFVKPVAEGNLKSVICDDNKVYLGTRTGSILVYNINEDYSLTSIESTQPSSLDGTINDILIKGDEIYLCADAGLFYGDKGSILDISEVKSYSDDYNSMEKAFFDYEGNLWLASSSLGVYKISTSQIVDYFFEYGIDNAITYAIEKFHGYTFIGTGDGLRIVSDEGKKIEIPEDGYNVDIDATEEEKQLMQFKNIIGSNAVRDIEVYKNNIYFATYGTSGYLFYFIFDNIGTEESCVGFLKYDLLSEDYYDDQIDSSKDFRSLKATDDYLFVGLDRGISRYDGQNYDYIDTGVYPLYMTVNNNDLYVVLNTIGVSKVAIESFNNFERIDPNNNYSTLKCMYVNDGILFSDNNVLYFSKNGTISKINLDIVGSVVDLFYVNNKYYICSEANVYISDDIFAENPTYTLLDSSSGLKSSLVANSTGLYDSETNQYYFATSSGVLIYNLGDDSSEVATAQRKIAIDTVYIDNELITEVGDLSLKSSNKNIIINFSVLSFRKEQNYNVYYKLNGYDADYQKLTSGDSFQITYKNLEGGQYSFELYTEDFDGTRSATTITFNVNKDKKITEYEAFWVVISILITVSVATAITLFARSRIKKSIKLQNEYKEITIESIEAIARTIDAKDTYTNGHSKRVGIYSREIAKALNLTDEEVENIYYIALLHDIGKISIPLDILNKPGKLTDEEFEIMKTHTTAGGKILEGISTIPHIVEGAMYHHEKYVGGGYPKGLKGEDIPFIARIICCADCYDAMATRRTYKEPYTKEKIISEFERCSGSQFDPEIAKIVIELIKEDKLKQGIEEKE